MKKKMLKPLMFSNRDDSAIITTEVGDVEICGRDVSRLYFILANIMDRTDMITVRADIAVRLSKFSIK